MKLKQLQKLVAEFCRENNLESPIEHKVLDLVSEVGEVSKEISRMTNYGRKPLKFRKELASEVGDVLYSLIVVANHFEIDLEEALKMVLEKYKKRLKKGSPGSEFE